MSVTRGPAGPGASKSSSTPATATATAAAAANEDAIYPASVNPTPGVRRYNHSTNGSNSSSRLSSWHIPRPSLVGRSERNDSSIYSEPGTWNAHHHHHNPSDSRGSRSSSSSQGSQASTHSAASGTLLLTAANLASLASMHPPTITAAKQQQFETTSVASSTHFTVVNGLGRPHKPYRKSWCARNQLTVLICSTCFLFMVGLLAGILYMDVRIREREERYN